jgi:YidC/Oxa1 family membrane protein insertase
MDEMSDQVRGIIFVVVVLVVIFLWSHFYGPTVPPPQKSAQTSAQQAAASQTAAPQTAAIQPAAKAVPEEEATPAKVEAAAASAENIVTIDSGLYHVELSNRGGVVRSWKLKKYFDDQKPPQPLELVNRDAAQQLGWPFSIVLSDSQLQSSANSALYEVTPSDASQDAPTTITFHWSDGHLDITKKLNFTQNYEMSADVTAALDGRPLPVALAWRGGFGDKAVYKASSLVTVFYKSNDKLNLLQYKKLGVT